MKVLVLAGFLLVFIAAVQGRSFARRDIDDDGDDSDDDETIEWVDETWFEDDDGNLVQANLDVDAEDETIAETRNDLSNRVFFYLYTPENPTSPQQLYVDDVETLESSNWDSSRPTCFIAHGWINSYKSEASTLVRDAFLETGDYNVIVVDWGKIAKRTYIYSSSRVKIVGEWISYKLNFLEKQGLDLSTTLLVGHSLGAHVVGLAALQATNNVGHVVGLDPALPLFYTASSGSRIASGDADYVEIIHTNGGKLGYSSAIGDVDFYPNGGSSQAGCYVDVFGTCAHARAYKYYAESLTSTTGFYGTACTSWKNYKRGRCSDNDVALMGGIEPTTSANGSYYLYTNKKSPYAQGA